MNTLRNILLLVLALLIGFVVGSKFSSIFSAEGVSAGSDKFNEVLNLTKKHYYKDISTNELVDDAIVGMLESLDPHSVYIPPVEQEAIAEQFKGNFDGIGIEFQILEDTITVVTPIVGGPSEAVGIFAGDRIVEIEKKNCVGFDNQQVLKNLRGDRGTKVKLKIYRPFGSKLIDFTIVRDQIPLHTVEASILVSDSVGYVSLSKFTDTSTLEVKDALSKLAKIGMKKVILDLRNNPGGYLKQAHQIADLFIDSTKMIVYTKEKNDAPGDEYKAEKDYHYENMPLVVLINKGSASASEIVSGAIQDWDRGLIVGETSFGKGLVQRPFTLPDKSAVRLTIAKYFTPLGRAIQRSYKNRDDYYVEVHDRVEEEGENFAHNAELDSTKKVFYTKSGKKVLGGGGITPDYIVVNNELTDFSIKLRSNNIFYEFIRKYLDANGNKTKIVKNYNNDFLKFKDNFSLTEKELGNFVKFVISNNITFDKNEFNHDKKYIKQRLKAHIAREFWQNNGWYAVLLKEDKQFTKAHELIRKINR